VRYWAAEREIADRDSARAAMSMVRGAEAGTKRLSRPLSYTSAVAHCAAVYHL